MGGGGERGSFIRRGERMCGRAWGKRKRVE